MIHLTRVRWADHKQPALVTITITQANAANEVQGKIKLTEKEADQLLDGLFSMLFPDTPSKPIEIEITDNDSTYR